MSPVPPAPGSGSILSPDPVLHLVRRATHGLTPGLLEEVRRRGRDNWLQDQLHPERVDDGGMKAILDYYPAITMSAEELVVLPQKQRRDATTQLSQATLARQLFSRRQLLEIMTEFWNNHFNAPASDSTFATKPPEDRTVIRANALGRFENLLLADAKSPPMLFFLGNYRSSLESPNENYGRELLELHTVGIDAGYTENDVKNSALVLTGRTIDDLGLFIYDPEMHHVGSVRVLGWSSPNSTANGGMVVSDDYLRYLAGHRSTALHLSRKLAVRFVTDDPPQSLVNRLADTYQDNGTAIVPWLEALFDSTEFANSAGAKTRRPLEDYAASLRALGIQAIPANGVSEIKQMYDQTGSMGQAPLASRPPTGYPDTAAEWESVAGTLKRWNAHHQMATQNAGPLQYPPLEQLLAGPTPATNGEMVDRLCGNLTGQTFRPMHQKALLDFAGMTAGQPYDPEATEYYLAQLVVLILDSPYHTLR